MKMGFTYLSNNYAKVGRFSKLSNFRIEFHYLKFPDMQTQKSTSVDDYIASFPAETKALLTNLRSIIKQIVPDATEKMSYNMPGYFLNGALVWFAGYKKHIGFYPSSSAITAFEDQLSKYSYSKGAIQFSLDKPLPVTLITKIVKYRMKMNSSKKKSATTKK